MDFKTDFLSAGGNLHPSAADWDSAGSGILAYGAGPNVALWRPLDHSHQGIFSLLNGHTAQVNAVKFISVLKPDGKSLLLTGGADGAIRLWKARGSSQYEEVACEYDPNGRAINSIAVSWQPDVFITAATCTRIRLWRIKVSKDGLWSLENTETIETGAGLIPLTLAQARIPGTTGSVIAVAGTKSIIQLFVALDDSSAYSSVAKLSGHEGWIRSLSFAADADSSLILASASQDKYIRLWRLRESNAKPATKEIGASENIEGIISNKTHNFVIHDARYTVAFEALLLGHEDWIYTASWSSTSGTLRLLSSSADNSLAIWEADAGSGVWSCTVRLGELISQKGATTATGSTGGFWVGLWSPDGSSVVSLGRTGSWRLWTHEANDSTWKQQVSVTGHQREVRDLAWAANGSYLVTTAADQTTRMFAEWRRIEDSVTWHEFARPQIHGYDLNCIDTINSTSLVSGADEKVLRVFVQPRGVNSLFHRLSKTGDMESGSLSDAATIPVLGLSNKAVVAPDKADERNGDEEDQASTQAAAITKLIEDMKTPPLEDHLSRYLLWPEAEKLYGHGYEISAVAASHDGTLIASACRATSLDHAVIRIFRTSDWRMCSPALTAHSLTVSRIRFSDDDQYLLSVGRDRQYALFHRSGQTSDEFNLAAQNPKAHGRMILDCAWAPSSAYSFKTFATAGRDKRIHIWTFDDPQTITLKREISETEPVTAVAFHQTETEDNAVLAAAMESGTVKIFTLDRDLQITRSVVLPAYLSPSASISRLEWRPVQKRKGDAPRELAGSQGQLAMACSDSSLRIISVAI